MLIHHIKNSDKRTSACQIYDQPEENQWPGLAAEAENICVRLGIDSVDNTEFSRKELKTRLTKAVK